MGQMVTLRHTSTGEPITVDTDSVDVAAAIASKKFEPMTATAESTLQVPLMHTTPTTPQMPIGRRLLKGALDATPTVAGAAGGVLGGAGGTVFGMGVGGVPGAVGGAAVGGAGGEAVRELGYRAAGFSGAPDTPQDAAQRIASQAGVQGVSELGGQALMRGGRAIAPKLMEAALPLTARLRKAFRGVDFPGQALEHGIATSEDAVALRKASAAEAGQMVDAAAANNPTNISAAMKPDDVRWIIQKRGGLAYGPKNFTGTSQVSAFVDDVFAHSSAPAQQKAAVREYLKQWAADNGHRITPSEWYDAAQGLQQEARATYLQDQGKGAAGQALDSPYIAKAKQKLAAAIKARLRDDIPGLGEADARTQSGMALEQAFSRVEGNRPSLMAQALPWMAGSGTAGALGATGHGAAMLPAALGVMGATHVATNPNNLARAALLASALRTSAGQDVLRQGIRVPVLASDLLTSQGGSR
jgi:hypothetical protein